MFETILQTNPQISRETQIIVITVALRYLEKVKRLDGISAVESLIDSGTIDCSEPKGEHGRFGLHLPRDRKETPSSTNNI